MDKFLKYVNRKFSDWGHTFLPLGFFYVVYLAIIDVVVTHFYLKKSFGSVKTENCGIKPLANPQILDLVTVAFNSQTTIAWQIKFLKKHLKDSFNYTVADNSPSDESARDIERLCGESGVGYIRLPKNPYTGRLANWSHGLALNWVYKNFFFSRGAAYFGFLDHDIFPTEPTNIIPILKQHPIYGAVHGRKGAWYLWPGFCFFRQEVFKGKKVNFSSTSIFTWRPVGILDTDTGGGNWRAVYSKMDKSQVKQAVYEYAFLNNNLNQRQPFVMIGNESALKAKYGEQDFGSSDRLIEFVDTWLHLRRIGYGNPDDVKLKLTELLGFYIN